MERKIIEEFREYLLNNGKASGTVESYATEITIFFDFLESIQNPYRGKLERVMLLSYKDELLTNNAKPSTINRKVNSINVFNTFLIKRGVMTEKVVHPNRDKVRTAHGSEAQVTILSEDEINKLLSYVDSGKVSIRNRLIIYMLLYTGVRVSELVNIKRQNIDWQTSFITIDYGKGGVVREVPLKSEVLKLIEEYIDLERVSSPFSNSKYLLLSQRAGIMHRDAVNRVLKSIGKELDIHLHCHLFRHTTFSLLVKRGVPISTVSKLAGHSNINTTTRFYISTSREDKRNAIDLL